MSAQLTLVSHAPTAATATSAFPADEPLDARGHGWADEAVPGRLGRVDVALTAPERACRQTGEALGLTATVEPAVRDWALGRWRGRTLDEVAMAEPLAVQSWLTDPAAAPHGAEPLAGLLARVADWLAAAPDGGHTAVLTHPAVIRAAIVTTLAAPPEAFWRIDITPLSATRLRGRPGRWTLRTTGHPLRGR